MSNDPEKKNVAIVWSGAEADQETKTCRRQIHEILTQANYDYDRKQFNTVVSATMKLLNALEVLGPSGVMAPVNVGESVDKSRLANMQRALVRYEGLSILFRLLAPITPHVSHILWIEFGYGANILDTSWPKVDASALQKDALILAVQVNGKLRGQIEVAVDAPRDHVEKAALANPDVARYVGDAAVKKVIIVPGKIVNIVV
jgi:leucyl-tRNA synthetase